MKSWQSLETEPRAPGLSRHALRPQLSYSNWTNTRPHSPLYILVEQQSPFGSAEVKRFQVLWCTLNVALELYQQRQDDVTLIGCIGSRAQP